MNDMSFYILNRERDYDRLKIYYRNCWIKKQPEVLI